GHRDGSRIPHHEDGALREAPSSRIDTDLRLFSLPAAGAEHAFGIEFDDDLAARVDGDDPSLAAPGRQLPVNDLAPRGADAAAAEAHPRADVMSHHRSNEHFAVSRRGNRA